MSTSLDGFDGDAGQHRAGGVTHEPGDRGLRPRCCRHEREDHEREDDPGCSTMWHLKCLPQTGSGDVRPTRRGYTLTASGGQQTISRRQPALTRARAGATFNEKSRILGLILKD